MSKMDDNIEAMWRALPASTMAEIADKMAARGHDIGVGGVGACLAHLRKNAAEYGWTVPHVRRGRNPDGGKRFLRLLTDRDGSYIIEDGDNTTHVYGGLMATVSHVKTMSSNETAALLAAVEHTRSITARRRLREVADDLGYVSRKAAALLEELRDAA